MVSGKPGRKLRGSFTCLWGCYLCGGAVTVDFWESPEIGEGSRGFVILWGCVFVGLLFLLTRKCATEGIGRQGRVLNHRNCLQKQPMPCRPTPLLVQL